MDKKSLKVKIFLDFYRTYKEVHSSNLLNTTSFCLNFCMGLYITQLVLSNYNKISP